MDGYGTIIDPLSAPLPEQDWEMITLHADRFIRAMDAQEQWALKAKECVEFFEGKQWSAADLAKLEAEGRPALTINKLRPLVNLVIGYHLNNQTATKFLPGNDGTGTADIARVLSAVSKQIGEMNELPFIDAEVFLDGLLTGRGYYDIRMDFAKNSRGHVKYEATDPFTVYPDPDANTYDLNTGSFLDQTRWVSVDEVEAYYGRRAAEMIRPLTNGMTYSAMPSSMYQGSEEITPWRNFGGDQDNPTAWRLYSEQFYNWVDTYRKTIRLIDTQHYVRVNRWFFVDLETGDQKPVPDHWGPEKVQRVMMWAQENNEPLVVQNKPVRRLRWTHMVGDVVVFDQWSPYDTFTKVPFFPYFRRGQTQGMVEPLVDVQREINVRRSARQNIIGRQSNGGWMYEKGSLDAQQKMNLEVNGGKPGFQLEFDRKNGQFAPPQQIGPGQSPVSVEQLEKEADNDMPEIAGINKAGLGQVDKSNVSGLMVLAQQRQMVVGLEGFISNYHRTKRLTGAKELEIIQAHYTERRIVRTVGEGKTPIEVVINERSAAGIANDVTLGGYTVSIDDTSLSDSFLEGQFNELLTMKQAGMPIPDDFLIDASSIGRKEELRLALAAARQAMAAAGVPAGDAPGQAGGPGPGGSKVGMDGGSMPAGPEMGAPAAPPIA